MGEINMMHIFKNRKEDNRENEGNLSCKKINSDFMGIVNGLLVFVLIVLTLLFCYKYYIFTKNDGVVKNHVNQNNFINKDATVGLLKERKSFSDYKAVIKQRDIFQASWNIIRKVKAFPELSSKIKLVGIILDENPVAIVEDLTEKETIVMSKGDKIYGALLNEILDGKVIFIYNGEEIEVIQ